MEQFSLEKYLENPSRKVVTRDGKEVTIEKTDIHIHGMSHMILGKYSDIYEIWHSNGRINYTGSDCNLDIFFADKEEDNEFTREGLWDSEKVTKWLENHVRDYKYYDSDFRDGNIDVDDLVDGLRKAMEETMSDKELIKKEKLTETDKCMLEAIEYCCKIKQPIC